MIQQNVFEWAKERGYKVGFVDIGILENIKNRLAKRKADGEFAPGFYEENLAFFKYLEGSSIRRPGALLHVVIPRPAHTVSFEFEGGRIEAVLPPTYVDYRPLFEKVRLDLIKNALGPDDRIETLQAPLKSLAAAIGLVCYGRNNITYIPEYGSYFQLAGYVLEQPLEGAASLRPEADTKLGLCSSCRACVKACPMKAITEERFLIHAERCYTLFSESKRPIPEGLRPPSPDCLVGCLKCQKVCPANKGLLRRESTGVSFSVDETEAFLRDGDITDDRLRKSVSDKFGSLGLGEGIELFRRNLRRMCEVRALSFCREK